MTETAGTVAKPLDTSTIISPARLAHFVLRTSRFQEMIDWYKAVLGAEPAFQNEILAFLSYDEEHHRVAFLHMPDLKPQPEGIVGVHHVAFTYDSLSDLLATYKRLRDLGIKPIFPINHGPTTSMYYADPDGNQVELQVDNYDNIEDATAFFFSEAFAENPIGVEFDPEDLLARVEAGEDQEALKRRPDIGKRGLEAVKLR
ncbi:VOC family protein [Novosphingobium colocasiae]|uniref:VOC family protein n=1 Tax=Novosphingobium colocasiae TaxID=1256513 RepID=UPI0035B3155D